MTSHPQEPLAPSGGEPADDAADDLSSLLPDVDEPTPVFFRSALVYFGPAAQPLMQAFDSLYLMAVESDYYDSTIPQGALFGVEAEAVARDLKALSYHVARLAAEGPLDPKSLRQRRTSLAMAEIARDLDRHRRNLEAAYAEAAEG